MSSSYRRDSAPRRGGYATISSTRNSGKPDSKPYSKGAHGMQSLGKIAPASSRRVPAPASLPSLRSENDGNDPNVALVPPGGSGWKSSKEEEKETVSAAPKQQPKAEERAEAKEWGKPPAAGGKKFKQDFPSLEEQESMSKKDLDELEKKQREAQGESGEVQSRPGGQPPSHMSADGSRWDPNGPPPLGRGHHHMGPAYPPMHPGGHYPHPHPYYMGMQPPRPGMPPYNAHPQMMGRYPPHPQHFRPPYPSYDMEHDSYWMRAREGGHAPMAPIVKEDAIRSMDLPEDGDSGWAGHQDEVDYSKKVVFEDSSDEERAADGSTKEKRKKESKPEEKQDRGEKLEQPDSEKQGIRMKSAEGSQAKMDTVSKDTGPPVSEAHGQVPIYPPYPPSSAASQGHYPPYYDQYAPPYMYPPGGHYPGYPPNVQQPRQGGRGIKRTPQEKEEGPVQQNRWDSHRPDQGESKKHDERPRILAKHEKKREPEEAEGTEAKEAKDSGGSKRTSLSEVDESSHHVTFAESVSGNMVTPAMGDVSGQVAADSQLQKSQPRKIMTRHNAEPAADESHSKPEHVAVQKAPIKEKPKQVQVQESHLKEEEVKAASDETPDSPGKPTGAWNVLGRGPIKSKTLYEPEGKESEEKFKKYLHTAEGSSKFHKAEKDSKQMPPEPRHHNKDSETKDAHTLAGASVPSSASVTVPSSAFATVPSSAIATVPSSAIATVPSSAIATVPSSAVVTVPSSAVATAVTVTEVKAPSPVTAQETNVTPTDQRGDMTIEHPEPPQVPSEGPPSTHKFPQKTAGRQRNAEDRQRGDSYDGPRRRDGDYSARGRRGGGRGKDWQDRPAKGRGRQEHPPRDDQDRRDHPARDQDHLVGDQERRGHSLRDQDRRDHPARNQDKRDYSARDLERRDYPVRDQERQDHPRDRGRQEYHTKGKDKQDYPGKEREGQDHSAREHGRQDQPKYQDRRDQQEEFAAAREQDRQSRRRGQDQPQPTRDKDRQVYSQREREQQEINDYVAREKDGLAVREPDTQEHQPRQREWHRDVPNQYTRQDDRSGPRPRGGDRRGPRVQEGREQDERKKVQGQKQEKLETLLQEAATVVDQNPTLADDGTVAFEGGEKIAEKHVDTTPSNVQVPEPNHGTVDDGNQRRGADNHRKFETRQWNNKNKDNRRQGGQVRSGGGPRQRGDGQRSSYGDHRQRGNWERDSPQTSSQSTAELVDPSHHTPPVAPAAKDTSLEPRTPTESSVSLKGVAESTSQPPPPLQGPLVAKQERAKWDQRPPREEVGGGGGGRHIPQSQRRYDQRERQTHRDESAGGQHFRGKDVSVVAGDKQSMAEVAQENKNQTSGSVADSDKRLVEEQKPLRESRETSSRRPAKGTRGGGGARGRRSAGYERVQQPRDNMAASSELEARSKNSPNADLGYSQLEDINSGSDFSDFEEEPAPSSEKVQQDQAKPPQTYRGDQYRPPPRSFRGNRRHVGGEQRGAYHSQGRGRGRTRNEGERRDRHRSAEVVGTGTKENTQVTPEIAAMDEDASSKLNSNKEVKGTIDKKEVSTGPKSDLSLYDLHSHKVAIVDDNMKEVEDDRDSGNNGAFVEVTSKRTQKEKQKKEREEQQRKEEVGRHRDEDRHRKGHKSRPAEGGIQVQPPRTAWTKPDLEESTPVAWGTNDPSNVATTSSSSSSSWIINSLPSNAAPGAELKMANQRTDAVPSSTAAVTRGTTQPPPPTPYTGKDGANTGNSGSGNGGGGGGGGGGFTPFSSPFQLSLLSAAVDQSMSSGHDVLPTPSSEKPLAAAKVFAQEETKGSVEVVGRAGAVGHGKDVVPPRFQSAGRGRGHSSRQNAKAIYVPPAGRSNKSGAADSNKQQTNATKSASSSGQQSTARSAQTKVPTNTSHTTPKGSFLTGRRELVVSDCRNSTEQQQPPQGAGSSAGGISWDAGAERGDRQVQVDARQGTIGTWGDDPQGVVDAGGNGRRDLDGRLESSGKVVGQVRQEPQSTVPQVEPSVPAVRPPTTFGTKSYAGALKLTSSAVLSVKLTSSSEHVDSTGRDPPAQGKPVVGSEGVVSQSQTSSQPVGATGPAAALASTSAVSLAESSHSSVTDSSHSGSGSGLKSNKSATRNSSAALNAHPASKGPPPPQPLSLNKGEGVKSTNEKTRLVYGSSEEPTSGPPVASVAKPSAQVIHKESAVLDTPLPKTVPANLRQPVSQPSAMTTPVQQSVGEQKQAKPPAPGPPLMELAAELKPPPPQLNVVEQAGVVSTTSATHTASNPALWFSPVHQGMTSSNQSRPASQQLLVTQRGLSSTASDQGTLLMHHSTSTFPTQPHSGSLGHLSSVSTAAVQLQSLPFGSATGSAAAISSQDIAQQSSLANIDSKSNLSIAAPAFVPSRPSPSPSSGPQSCMTHQMPAQLRAEFMQPPPPMSMISAAAMHRPHFPTTGGIPVPPASIRVPASLAPSPAAMLGMFSGYMQLPVQTQPPLVPPHHFMMSPGVVPLQQPQPQQKGPSAILAAQGLVQQLQMAESNPALVQVISPGSDPMKSSSRKDVMRGMPHSQAGRHQSRSSSDRHALKSGKRLQGFDGSLAADSFPAHSVSVNKGGGPGTGVAKSQNKAPLLPTPSFFPSAPTIPPQMQQLIMNGLPRMPPFLPGLPRSNSYQYNSRQY